MTAPGPRIHIGTSGWNYPEWKGSFYPNDMKPAAMLPYYATRFGTVEVNATWFTDDVYTRLAGKNAALCVADNDDGATPAVATADWGYLRLRATGYSDDDLRGWLATMRRIGERWREAFVFFKHEEAGTGPALGARLQALL